MKITETAKLHLYTVNFDQGSTQRFSITWLLCSLSFFFHLTYGFRLLIWYLLTLPLKLTFFELNLIIGLDLTGNFFSPLALICSFLYNLQDILQCSKRYAGSSYLSRLHGSNCAVLVFMSLTFLDQCYLFSGLFIFPCSYVYFQIIYNM